VVCQALKLGKLNSPKFSSTEFWRLLLPQFLALKGLQVENVTAWLKVSHPAVVAAASKALADTHPEVRQAASEGLLAVLEKERRGG
jgi:hypothetical protein